MKHRKLWVLTAVICMAGGLTAFAISAQQQPPPPQAGYGPPPPPAPGYGPPPPAPAPTFGTVTSLSGTVTQFNYGPNALPESFMLNRSAIVHFPPDLGCAISGIVRVGDAVKVEGLANTNQYGTQSLELQTVIDSTNGRQLAIPQPGTATAYTASGTIRQLNYGPQGEINGFWLNKVLVHIPPMPPGGSSALQVGATASVSGYSHRSINNVTAVDASSLTINGQTIPIYAAPPPPPAPGAVAPPPAPGCGTASSAWALTSPKRKAARAAFSVDSSCLDLNC
jgi:hypothetical protein